MMCCGQEQATLYLRQSVFKTAGIVQIELLHTCPEDMPLLVEEEDVLPEPELKALQASLLNSSWIAPLGRRAGKLITSDDE